MNADLKNSETIKNLMRAFAGESQARNRYTFAAGTAKKEGLPVVEAVFKFTADQEKEHAEVFYKLLKELTGASIRVDGSYPVDTHEKTIDLLRAANHNEMEEHDVVYRAFGDKALEEGFKPVSYTHLDVYKRQGERPTGASRSSARPSCTGRARRSARRMRSPSWPSEAWSAPATM